MVTLSNRFKIPKELVLPEINELKQQINIYITEINSLKQQITILQG